MVPEIRHILVPIDITDASSRVAGYATAMAERFHARVTALYVVEESEGILGFTVATRDTDESEAELESEFAQKLSDHAHRYLPSGTEVRVVEGEPHHRIVETAREVGADLILMGHHLRGKLERLMNGSVAEHVLRESQIPLLVVPVGQD
ncbi:MAG: universal stress protein [Candidatus Dadabacteria bacterium]|nr:MAG: universal stress protein [Candidatus Dadabacteria bacterium]